MPALLVTYDLKTPGQDYSKFYDVIKSYSFARLSESSYAISTDESPRSLFDKLSPHIDQNDVLFVVGLKRSWCGYGQQAVFNWLDKNLAI
jgi:hypothetical protein